MTFGTTFGSFCGWAVAVAIILIIPGDEGFLAAILLGAGLTGLGGSIGRAGWDR